MPASPEHLVTAVRRAVMHLAGEGSRYTRAHGLNLTDVRGLVVLLDMHREGEPATPGRLGDRLGLASASTTQLVDRLQARGLVRREPDPGDRRSVRLQVTAEAVSSGEATFGPLLTQLQTLAVTRTPTERDVICAFLEELTLVSADASPAPSGGCRPDRGTAMTVAVDGTSGGGT